MQFCSLLQLNEAGPTGIGDLLYEVKIRTNKVQEKRPGSHIGGVDRIKYPPAAYRVHQISPANATQHGVGESTTTVYMQYQCGC